MPTFSVVAHKDGRITLMTTEQMENRQENNDETVKGQFTAENSTEARRLFVTDNPAVEVAPNGTMKLAVQVGQDADADRQRQELHRSVMDKAIEELKVPQGSDPEAYGDEAHIRRGEMLSPEERAAQKDAEKQPRGQNVFDPRDPSGQLAARNQVGQVKMGNTGKQGGAASSRAANTGNQPAGVVDAGSPNAGSPGTGKDSSSGSTGSTSGAGQSGSGAGQSGGQGAAKK